MAGSNIHRNMGSPMNPEGTPHWTLKNLLTRMLRRRLEDDIPYLAGYFDECCDGECQTTGEDSPVPVFENLSRASHQSRSRGRSAIADQT